ncbi:MAG: L-threonylcarbamoyladenylate synthase [Acidobacteriota bacterium]
MTSRLPFRDSGDLKVAVSATETVARAHGVIAIPTETFYGLAVPPDDARAVQRVLTAKGRPVDKALPVVAASLEQAEQLVHVPSRWRERLAGVWPAPLTVVLPLRRPLASASTTLAVRVPAHALLRALLLATGPLTATSANLSGAPPIAEPDGVLASLGAWLELLLDGGVTPGGAPSTLIDLTGPQLRVLREGAWRVPLAWQ